MNETDELYDHRTFIANLYTQPERTPSLSPLKLQIYHYEIETINGRIFIRYKTNIGPFTTQILSTKQLTPKEVKMIYDHYENYFKESPTLRGTLPDFLQHEIYGVGKLIELMFNGDNDYFGMHLHKVFKDERYPNCISHYVSASYIHKKYRSLGFFDPFLMTLPALMPKLFKDKFVIGSWQALFIGTENLLKDLETFPHIWSDYMAQYVNDNFVHIQEASDYDPNPVLVNNRPGECWSKLPVQLVKDSDNPVVPLSTNKLSFAWQRGIHDPNQIDTSDHHALMKAFVVSSDKFFKNYIGRCKAKLKLKGGKFLNALGPHVPQLLPPELKPSFIKEAVTLPSHDMLFSKGVVVPSNTKIPASCNQGLESKL